MLLKVGIKGRPLDNSASRRLLNKKALADLSMPIERRLDTCESLGSGQHRIMLDLDASQLASFDGGLEIGLQVA